MEYRRLGRTNLNVSVMGLGTGGPSQLGQKSGVAEAEAHRVVREALDLGINLIDTAAAYGASEEILGRALAGIARDRYVLCTKSTDKSGSGAEQRPRTGAELRESVERSLQRLGVDTIDVFQLHAVLPEGYDHARHELVPVMQDLQREGKIRFLGITESFAADPSRDVLQRAMADGVFDTILVGYNLLMPGPETDVLPLAEQTDTGVLVMCAVRRRIARPDALAELVRSLKTEGLIAPDALPDDGPLDWLLHDGVETVSEAAYRYVAMQPEVDCVLTGTANIDHLRANVAAVVAGPLPEGDVARLREIFGPVGRKLGD